MNDAVARALVFRLSSVHFLSRCLHAITEIGVADVLDETPQSAEQLASKVGADADVLNRVLRALAGSGVFEERDGLFVHSAASRYLRSDHEGSLDGLVRFNAAAYHWRAWEALPQMIRSGRPAFEAAFGCKIFDYFKSNPADAREFNRAMTANARRSSAAVAEAYSFETARTIADIGGGVGHLINAILSKVPTAVGTLVDLPPVIEDARKSPSDRLSYQGVDFFKDDMPVADVYLMMSILHNWLDAECVAILRNLRRATAPGSRVLIIELLLPEGADKSTAKIADVHMFVMFGGRERTETEYAKLLSAGGFRLSRVRPTASTMHILEAVPE